MKKEETGTSNMRISTLLLAVPSGLAKRMDIFLAYTPNRDPSGVESVFASDRSVPA